MADLITTRASLIACMATPEALDTLEGAHRIAPDEALVVTAPKGAGRAAAIQEALVPHDPHAMVVETTDAWQGLTLAGQGARQIFAHLSQLALPETEGFVQGDVGRLPAKLLVRAPGDRVTMFVPASQAHALRERILGLGAVLRPEPEPWSET